MGLVHGGCGVSVDWLDSDMTGKPNSEGCGERVAIDMDWTGTLPCVCWRAMLERLCSRRR
ncbi:hypothetical protein GCM10009006_36620 [Haloarcula argentinensis]|uniref:Uncharacterized protein n=1 Tax=Haloarcula argentinensis TaxID=43776 RepID=A0A830FRU0_HALAR|nr:hypothetical protein GCM10009006_36620 [Haloarcula argentinensis]